MPEVRLCRIDAVPDGELTPFNIGGIEVLVINLNGSFFCLAARCTHAGAPLGDGTLINDVLVCPWHGSNFRVTDGAVLQGPAEKPIKVYANKIKNDYIFIEL